MTSYDIIPHAVVLFLFVCSAVNYKKLLQSFTSSIYFLYTVMTVPNYALDMTPHQKYHVIRNSRNWLVTTGFGACCYAQRFARKTQSCCICLTCKTFQRYVSFKICKGLFCLNDNYHCVRRFVVSDPELPDSLYTFYIL